MVTLTATVTAGATQVKVGQINFCDAAAKYCTDIHLLGTAQLTQAGNATFRFRPSAGSHSYYAVFVGTTSYAASASGTAKLTVTETGLLPAAVGVAQSGSPGSYTLTATVGGRGNKAPTGTVSFLDTSNGNAVLGTATLGLGTAGLGFLNSSYSSMGLPLWDIAVGDFNADGILDVAFVGFNENTLAGALTVLLGNGDGTFTVATSLAMPNEPISIAVGDFNGDGKADLAIANWGNSTVSVLLGNGDGTFSASTSSPATVSNPGSMTVGDFNGDGIPDLAVTNTYLDSVTVLLGDGDGTFAAAPTITGISGGYSGLSVASGDFNQDGITDLAVLSQGDGVSPSTVKVLLGKGDGTFTPMAASPTVGVEPLSIAVADLNGDGIPDLAVPDANGYYNNVTVLLGNGDGTFTATASPTTGKCPRSIVVGDFNGDGIPDLATGNSNPGVIAGTVTLLLGNGDGTFTAMASSATGDQPYAIAAGEFDGDGISDLAIANFNIPGSVTVLVTETQTATATVTGITLPVATGTHLVVAKYSGDKIYSAATSGPTALATGTATPTVTLTPSANPATYGTSLTFTTTVSGVGDTPTGNVTFLDGSIPLGTGTLVGGIATFSSGALAVGSHSITVSYGGDGNYNPANSSVLNITVSPGTPAVSLTSSATPAPYGTTVTFTASVTGGGAVPTGTLAFFDGTTQLGIGLLRLGVASYSTSVLQAGPHSITASYGGDTNYTAQTSSILVETMVPATSTTLTVTSAGNPATSIAAGNPVTLTASVQLGGGLMTAGTVNFCDANAAHCADVHVLGTAQLTSAGTATINLRPGIGGHSFKAVFVGTSSVGTSTSSAVALAVIGLHPTTTAIAESGTIGNYTLTATVDGIGPVQPTGTVSFLDTSNNNAVLGTSALGAVSTGLSFLDASNPTDNSSPASIAVGDFNGDGIPDFAVANFGANNVTVFLGDGTGNFTAAAANPQTGNGPIAIAAGDFNGDGILDLAVGNYADSTITILLGDGKGNFSSTASPIATGVNPDAIAISDLNNDGNLDLAVTNYGSNTVTLLLGDGKGDFTATAASPATGAKPASIAVGDFNGDGIPDLATANSSDNTVTVLLGNGDGTFTAAPANPTTGNSPNSIVVGDFNNDGKTDLAVANFKGKSVAVLLGKGDGTFTTASSPATGNNPYSVVVADFNGDGIADLATANYNDNTVTVLLGDGNGNFAATSTSPQTGNYPVSLSAGDFNGDGWPDLVVANYHDTTITVLSTKITQVATTTVSGISPLGAGTSQVAAEYPGDSNYNPSISGTVGLTGQLLPPRMTLVASATNLTAGTPVTLTATVSGSTASPKSSAPGKTRALASTSTPAPTGTVTFLNGSAALGTSQVNRNGVAAYTTSRLAAGKDSVSASYAGDANYSPMTSSAVVISVSGTITPTLTVAPSTSSITTAQALTVAVVVNGGPGNPTATGTITLAGGGYSSGATALSTGSATINIPAGKLAIGADMLTVTYTPDSSSSSIYNNATGTSLTVTVTQAKMTPTVTVSPSATSITTAQALTVALTVSGAAGNPTPTGAVTLTSGTYTSSATTLNAGGATINIPAGALSTGNDTLTVVYLGDNNYGTATGTASINVNPSPSFTLSASPANVSIVQGGNGTSTMTVTAIGGFSGDISLSASGLPNGVTASFAAGSAAETQVLTLAASTSAAVTSTPVTVTITGTSGTLSANISLRLTIAAQSGFMAGNSGTTSITVAHGATTGNTGTISIVGTNGFSGTVNLTCKTTTLMTNVNDMPTCSLSPLSVNIQGATAQTSTLTINTTAATSANNQSKKVIWPSAGGATLALLLFFTLPKRRNWLGMLGVLVFFVSVGTLGCGGGGSSQRGGGGGNSGTTVGSYTITVNGTSGALSVTVGTVTLTVQ